MAKRRKSIAVTTVTEAPNHNLKQRFAQLRRRSEVQAPTFKLLRSTSVNSLDVPIDGDNGVGSGVGASFFRGSRESLVCGQHARAKSDSDGYPVYQNSTSLAGYHHDTCPDFHPTEQPPAVPSSEPPPLSNTPPPPEPPLTPNSYRREVALPPALPPSSPHHDQDPLDSVFERMERRRRRGVVVVDPALQPNPGPDIQGTPPQAAHPLHERIRRRRSRNYGDGSEVESALQSECNGGSTEMVNTCGVPDMRSGQGQEQPRRKLSDMMSRLSSCTQRANAQNRVSDSDRKQPRTLPAPPIHPRDSQVGEFIGSYNVRTASEQRAREEKAVQARDHSDSPSPYPATRNSYPPTDPALSPLRESRCSTPSSTSSHSSHDSSRQPRGKANMPRMRERAVSEERDLGTLTEQEYRDALRRFARSRASSVNSLR